MKSWIDEIDNNPEINLIPTCSHDWRIWPETDGNEQRCIKCNEYRTTPMEERFWLNQ